MARVSTWWWWWTDATIMMSDITTNNATTVKHWFLPKLSGNSLQFLDWNWNFAIPSVWITNSYLATSFTGQTTINITHNFGVYPVVQVVNNNWAVVIPVSITNNTLNDFSVSLAVSTTGIIIATVWSPQPQNLISVSANYTVLVSDRIIQVTASNKTITLPTAVGNTGRQFIIKNISGGNTILATTSLQLIDWILTQTIPSYSAIDVYSDWVNYYII